MFPCSLGLVFFLLTTSVPAWCAQPAPSDPVSSLMKPGRQATYVLPATGFLSLGIAPQRGQQVEVLIWAGASNMTYGILSPAGADIRSGTVELAGWLAASFSSDAGGVYRLVIHANSPPAAGETPRVRALLHVFPASEGGILASAESSFSSAGTLRNSLQAGDVRLAILKYKDADLAWKKAGDRDGRLLALAGESLAWLDLCEYQNAIGALDRAIALLDARSGYFHSLLLSMKAEVYLAWWENKTAATVGAQALRIARELKDPELEARALAMVGGAEYFTHAPSAVGHLDEASRLAMAGGSPETLAMVLRYQAWNEEDRGSLSRALALMQQSEDGFRRAGDRRKALQTLPYLADIERVAGDDYEALLANSRLLPAVMASGDTENYGTVLGNTGSDYEALNRNRDAIAYLEKAVRAYESIHHDPGLSIYLGVLCEAESRQNRLTDALRDCQKSASLIQSIHDPKRLAAVSWQLGNVYQALGRTRLAVEQYRQAAAISAQVPDPRFESHALIGWGDALESTGQNEEALPLFEKAFALSEQAEDSIVQLEARFRIARWRAHAGQDADAIRELKIALDRIESRRSAVQNGDLRASYLAALRKCYQLYVDILMRRHDSVSGKAALEISESARARTLLDSLAFRGTAQRPEHAGEAAAERIKLRGIIDQAYERRLKLMLEGGHARELDENSAALTQAIDSLQRMDDEERADARQAAPDAQPMTTQQILEASRSSPSTLFEYALGADRSYLWIVRNGTLKSYIIHATQDEIQTLVRKWRNLAANSLPREGEEAELARVAAELSCKLIDPYLEQGMDKLAIAPDGDLGMLSFASLPMNGCAAKPGPPLITDHQVVMIPSLSTWLGPSQPPRTFAREVAVFADPVFDAGDDRVSSDHPSPRPTHISASIDNKRQGPALPRLIGTAEEASGIETAVGAENVSLFLGFNASVDTLLSPAMRDYRILHLATHGVLDTSAPGLSGLVLSLVAPDGRPMPGYLKTQDIAALRLSPDLVVLSSCDSGAGDRVGGEGVTGLAHAFLEAGASQVVSTLWSVDDSTTRHLMVDFYREMYRNGADPAEALRRAQVNMIARPHRSAPYYWAAFEITSVRH